MRTGRVIGRAAGVSGEDFSRIGRERALSDGRAQVGHQVLVVGQVVPGQQHRGDDLVRLHDVMEIGSGELAAGRATALRTRRK